MSKTVNVTFIVTRDGKATAQNFAGMGYATFVALEAACGGVLTKLQAKGSARVAAITESKQHKKPGGESDLRLELRADFGNGTADVSIGYTGIAATEADEITAMALAAVASVVGATK
jgi:hypothetical protein